MRLRPLVAAGAALAMTLVVVGDAAHARPRPERLIAACQYRVCFVLTDLKHDSDGDGFADVDERLAGTDPDNPHSFPAAGDLVRWFGAGQLPSFTDHHTEVVVLPTVTPDKASLATGLGAFPLPGDSVRTTLAGIVGQLRANGFDPAGVVARVTSMGKNGPGNPLGGTGLLGSVLSRWDKSWYSAGAPADYGTNAGKAVSSIEGGRPFLGTRTPETVSFGGWTRGEYEVHYADGSDDGVTATRRGGTTDFSVTSTDSKGNTVSETDGSVSVEHGPDGSYTETVSSTTTHLDPSSGKKTGYDKHTYTTTVSNGVKTTTHAVVHYDADGNETGGEVTESEPEECPGNKCSYSDPDYVEPVITDDDVARAVGRVNMVTTPGPDTGHVRPELMPDTKIFAKWVLYAYLEDDGVTTLSTEPRPLFNRAQPEYVPGLRDLTQIGGAPGCWPTSPIC